MVSPQYLSFKHALQLTSEISDNTLSQADMRRNLRTPLSLVVLIIAGFCIFWISKQSETEKPLETVPIVSHDHGHAIPELEPVEVDPILMDGFQSWMTAFRAGERGETFISQGLVLAEQRRSTMLELLQRDASLALTYAISYADYASLPDAMQAIVEEPFSSTGDLEVIALCDHDYHTPEYRVNVYLEDQQRLRTAPNSPMRSGLSKLDVPLQGIELGGWTALKPQVFDRLEGENVDWAWDSLPSGNPDSSVDFFTGEPLGANPMTVVAGGFSFLFANEENLDSLEAELISYDNMAGEHTGSSVIFSEEVQEVQAKGFPIEVVRNIQNQLAEDDTTGDKTSLFIQIVFTDKTEAPISKADLEAQINGAVSGHLADFSYNQTSMTATVTEKVYDTVGPSGDYDGTPKDEGDLWQEAVDAYKEDNGGTDPFNTYDIVGIIFPKIDSVGWAGLGTVGGANSKHWLNGVASTETIVHEYGHNYGLGHSNYWAFNDPDPTSTNPVDPDGSNEEYGDLWDVMGDGDANRGHFHMAAKRYLGWLGENQIGTLTEPSDSRTYRINRFDHKDATGLQGLEIKKSNDENYWVGFRRAFESNANYYQGAYILWERPPNGTDRNQGWIIDTTPESDAERQDSGIALGRTYSDPVAQVHITPITVGGSSPNEYLDVVVNVGDFSGNNAPTVSLNAPSTGDARTPIAISATGNDGDGDTLAYSWDLGNGEVYTSEDAITAYYTVGGTYTLSVTVTDMKGGTMTQSAQIVIDDPVNTWTTRTSGTSENLDALATNDTHVVAVGQSTILRSTDGQTWSDVTPGSANNVAFNDVVWAGDEFIAVGRDAEFQSNSFFGWKPVVYTSPDGSSWTLEFELPASAGSSVFAFNQLASNEDGSMVIALGDQSIVYKRIDGNWTEVDSLGLSASTSLGVGYGADVFILGGFDFTNQPTGLYLFRTSDGTNWEDLEDNSDLNPNSGLDSIAFLNDIFIGSGFNSRVVFSENRGISWQTLEQGNRHRMSSFAFGGGVFYSIGEDETNGGVLVNLVSNDGKIWKVVGSDVDEDGNDITYFNSSFIIVSDGGVIRQSGLVEAAEEVSAFDSWIAGFTVGDEGGASDNPDGDWALNLLERAVGSAPDDGDSAPAAPVMSIDGSGKIVFKISRLSKSGDVALSIEKSSNLKDWTFLATTITSDTDTMLELTSEEALAFVPCFLRVKAVE